MTGGGGVMTTSASTGVVYSLKKTKGGKGRGGRGKGKGMEKRRGNGRGSEGRDGTPLFGTK